MAAERASQGELRIALRVEFRHSFGQGRHRVVWQFFGRERLPSLRRVQNTSLNEPSLLDREIVSRNEHREVATVRQTKTDFVFPEFCSASFGNFWRWHGLNLGNGEVNFD